MGNKVVDSENRSTEPFALTVQRLIGGKDWTPGDRLALKPVLRRVRGWPHTQEYLRQMVMGDREPTPLAMEVLAEVVGRPPEFFLEYRLHQMIERCKRYPEIVQAFYEAVMAFTADLEAEPQKPNRGIKNVSQGGPRGKIGRDT